MNRDIVFARMSGNFLTEHLPDDWASWSDKKLQKFFLITHGIRLNTGLLKMCLI